MTDEEQKDNIISVRKPKKVLHFSDGILEIFDDDEKENEEIKVEPEINEKELSWTPWFLLKAQRFGTNVVSGLDYTGEKLASFLRITTPKYAYEIEQFRKMEAKRIREEKLEKENTWTISPESPVDKPITIPPAPLTAQSSDAMNS